MLYIVRDFHPLVLFYTFGSVLLTIGLTVGSVIWAISLGPHNPAGSTAVLISLVVQLGFMLVLFGMLFDFEHNRRLNPEV